LPTVVWQSTTFLGDALFALVTLLIVARRYPISYGPACWPHSSARCSHMLSNMGYRCPARPPCWRPMPCIASAQRTAAAASRPGTR
jgi:hypothetical protein